MRRYPSSVQPLQPGEFIEFVINCVSLTKLVQSYFRETDLPSLLCTLLFFNPNIQPTEAVPQEFALQFWNDEKATNAGLILEAIGLLLGSKGAGVGDNQVSSLERVMDVCTFSAASRRLRFHKIAHRNGPGVKRTKQAQSQGTTLDRLYVPRFDSPSHFLVSPPSSSRCCSPPTRPDLDTLHACSRHKRRRMGPSRGCNRNRCASRTHNAR